MDDLLDGPLSAYTARRLSVVFILSLSWLVAFPMYYSIYDARPFDDDEVALDCSCSSTIANTSRAEHDMCGACGDAGGELACAPHPGLLASSFGFYCDSKAVLALPSSCVITGLLVGGFLGGSLSDRFGRKNTLIGAMATQAFGTLAGAASPYYAAFLTCKVVTGLGLSGVTQAGYTLAAEIVGAKLRTPLSIELWAYMFAVMACLTALIAYLMRDLSWRIQEVVIAIPPAALCLLIAMTAPESPRWLLRQGRLEDAERVLQWLLRSDQVRLLPDDLRTSEASPSSPETGSAEGAGHGHLHANPATSSAGDSSVAKPTASPAAPVPIRSRARLAMRSLVDPARPLFSNTVVARVTVCEMVMWGACTLSFYGIAFNAAAMSDDPYMNVFLVSLPQIPSTFLCARFMDHPSVGRRAAITIMFGVVGACLFVGALYKPVAIAASMVGTFCATGAFNIVYVQVPELYPTAVRNTALGICFSFSRITSILASVLPSILGPTATLILIAAVCLAAAVCSLSVPETVGNGLPDRLPGAAPPAALEQSGGPSLLALSSLRDEVQPSGREKM